MKKILLPLWVLAAFALLLYSFTQVDLSLTLSRVSIYQTIEKAFQYIGYFNRPLSTYIFVGVIIFLFALYGVSLNLVSRKKIDRADLWKIVILVSTILFLSYTAFSYDLFNYIFDAKIFTHYHSNPYLHKALDYPGDPMLSFMHWTHRTYPYGPSWIFITIPLSFVGFGYFLLTFYLFKLLSLFAFLGSAVIIEKIAKKLELNPLLATAAFVLNPLVLVESLVTSHNDIVMVFFALLGLLMYLEKKYIKSLLALVVSIGVKYATVLMIPAIIARGLFRASRDVFFYILISSMLIAVLLATYRTQFQPWYLLFVLPFTSFIQNKYFIMIPVFVISFAALMQYVPFLYLGNWDPPVPTILTNIMYGAIIVSVIFVLVKPFIFPKKVE